MQWQAVSTLVGNGPAKDSVTITRELFQRLLIGALRYKGTFDENYYLSENSDIGEAIQSGLIASASEHYYESGYFEGRMPKRLLVDEKFYLKQNPDVVAAIRNGVTPSAQSHFDDRGFREGRAPHADFSLI
jgi:hypothetical protein